MSIYYRTDSEEHLINIGEMQEDPMRLTPVEEEQLWEDTYDLEDICYITSEEDYFNQNHLDRDD